MKALVASTDGCVRNEIYEKSQAVIYRHADDAVIPVSSTQWHKILAIANLLLPSARKATAVDPDEHGSSGTVFVRS